MIGDAEFSERIQQRMVNRSDLGGDVSTVYRIRDIARCLGLAPQLSSCPRHSSWRDLALLHRPRGERQRNQGARRGMERAIAEVQSPRSSDLWWMRSYRS